MKSTSAFHSFNVTISFYCLFLLITQPLSTKVERLSRGLVSYTCTHRGPIFVFVFGMFEKSEGQSERKLIQSPLRLLSYDRLTVSMPGNSHGFVIKANQIKWSNLKKYPTFHSRHQTFSFSRETLGLSSCIANRYFID